jgi:siderophore synthetase component
VTNLALARAAQPAPTGGPPLLPREPDLATVEQCVVDGHPLHPCCRTRTGMSTSDVLAYAPEHRPTVRLELHPVPASRMLVTGAWPGWLRDGAHLLLPLHPWQRARYGLPTTGATLPARPLMSLRTLALTGRPWHVKTAVDVQMTSAVRTVSPAAVHNGPVLSRLLGPLAARIGGIAILPEVAAGAVLVDGEPARGLAVALRRAPGPGAVPFAALSAPSPSSGRALVTEAVAWSGLDPVGFLRQTVRVTVPPLHALLDLGVALEAHGQNTLLALDRGRPAGLLYRDFGGVRISPARLAAHGIEAPPLHGDIATDDPAALRTKLVAALLSTVLAELVTTLGREYGIAPGTLWRAVAEPVRRFHAGPWPIKATTAMRLAADPVEDIWAELPDPLEALADGTG